MKNLFVLFVLGVLSVLIGFQLKLMADYFNTRAWSAGDFPSTMEAMPVEPAVVLILLGLLLIFGVVTIWIFAAYDQHQKNKRSVGKP